MTIEEKAEEYIEKNCNIWEEEELTVDEIVRLAYLDSAKENGVVWHDLRKDSNDLPEEYIPVLNQYGEHRSYDGHYWRDCDDVIYTNVIAWCEIPQFKE